MFDNLYCYAPVTVVLDLIANDGAGNGGEPAVRWTIRQPYSDTNRRGKLHSSRQAEIKT